VYINSPIATFRKNRAKTDQVNAWKNGYYETYRVNETVGAVRLHLSSRKCGGSWFAVAVYDTTVEAYHNKFALVDKTGKATILKNFALDRYLLAPGTIVNVGLARSQGYHHGGGYQVEFVSGPSPVLMEHVVNPKRVQF
jgi:hypothetical protein